MMPWMMSGVMIVFTGVGYYFWKKSISRISRAVVAGLTLAACAILWMVTFGPYAPMNRNLTDDQSKAQTRRTIKDPSIERTAPVSQPGSVQKTTEATVVKTTPNRVHPASVPVSEPAATAGPDSTAVKLSSEQLDMLIGDAVPIKPKGSTMVRTVVKKGKISASESRPPSEDDYSFPELIERPDGMWMIIPDEPLPSISSRRPITTANGEVPGPGEVVALSYDMFSWSSGEMVESSQTALNGPLMYRLGGKDTPILIPKYLDEAIRNRPYGSTVQVVFKQGMHDLPGYLNPEDGYVLVVRVDEPGTDGDSALEAMVNALTQ